MNTQIPLLGREPEIFLEDTIPDLVTASDSHTLRGAVLAADYIAKSYPQPPSDELKELVNTVHRVYDASNDVILGGMELPQDASTVGERANALYASAAFNLIVRKGFANPIINRNRAVGLFALAVHKVNTREDHTAAAIKEDFQRPFDVSEVYNRRDIRLGWLEPYRQKLIEKSKLSINEGLALPVTEQVAKKYTLTPAKLLTSMKQYFLR